jgi:hypothetical protein
MDVTLDELVSTIKGEIEARGRCVLFNGLLQLVWEGETHLAARTKKVWLQKFARLHGWSVRTADHGNAAVFKNSSSIPPLKSFANASE